MRHEVSRLGISNVVESREEESEGQPKPVTLYDRSLTPFLPHTQGSRSKEPQPDVQPSPTQGDGSRVRQRSKKKFQQ